MPNQATCYKMNSFLQMFVRNYETEGQLYEPGYILWSTNPANDHLRDGTRPRVS